MASFSFTASGTIKPSRFVKLSGVRQVAQAGDNEEILGVAMEGSNRAPLSDLVSDVYAAQAGESLLVYSTGEMCLVEAGAAVTAGDLLKSDAQGRAAPVATTGATIQNYGAIALDSAAGAGEKILALITPLQKVRPALT